MNIQQQTTLEVADTDIVMADNEELDTTPPQDISNVFAGLYLHLLFPALNHCLNPPYHHFIVDHLIETELT